jgi:NAD+ diphosphatase
MAACQRDVMSDLEHYSGQAFERVGEKRRDGGWIAGQLAAADTRIVPVWQGRSLLNGESAAYLPAGSAWHLIESAPAEPIFLGIDEGGALFALDVSHLSEADAENLTPDGNFEELYGVATQLVRREASLLSHAAWMIHWSKRHRFCGACGHPTRSMDAGHMRKCSNEACGIMQFPRTDPAVIMVVEHEDRCLLAHQKGWRGRLHSCLAGFVEPGESAEEAVIREVREESGLSVREVRYFATQPWPYPCSLMLGYTAVTDDPTIVLDDDELEKAAWFTREQLRAPDLDIELPRHDSIARRLIDAWIDKG